MKNGSIRLAQEAGVWPGVTLPSRRTYGYETNVGIAGSSTGLSLATVLP